MTTADPRPRLLRRSVLAAGATLPLAAPALAAGRGAAGGQGEGGEPDLKADLPRDDPGPTETAGAPAARFTAQMLAGIDRADVNAVCSPLSAQIALTMIGLGAAGDTRAQMEEVLGGSIDELASTANTLSTVLEVVGAEEREAANEEAPEPAIASLVGGTWLQEGMKVEQTFLGDLATYFGSGVHEVDFTDEAEREEGRERINAWVEDATNDLIEDLIPKGGLEESARLVLVNALHLKAAWPEKLTPVDGTFTTTDGEEVSTELLTGSTSTWYEDELVRATSLGTYGGDLALALVQPVDDLSAVLDAWSEAADSGPGLAALIDGLEDSSTSTALSVPGFDIERDAPLSGLLGELGMTDAFSDDADFSGITTGEQLLISEVLQKAVITVDAEGMEAAAATAVVMGTTSVELDVHELELDSPFLYLAYETSTRAPLVVGWIGDPTQTR